ncbi:MAG: ArsI/CadI family heavy metal resistance metalloenzyme [Proteobacteria bacterium]|nr:ArsI/CadI family heavy metal resistance metalloenzyme [Pseudomonadota bacterium]
MRFQLALNVDNLERAIEYYGKLFNAKVNKRKPGYANFAIDEPPLKLVLFEAPGASERLNHLGVELLTDEHVDAAIDRLEANGLATQVNREEQCCWADKKTVWSEDPQGMRWEWYKVEADLEKFGKGV